MLFKLLLGRINWFEWAFIAAFAALSITVVIQGYRMKINQLELQQVQATAQALGYENKFMSASKVIDEKITNNTLNEIGQLTFQKEKEKDAFHVEYQQLLKTNSVTEEMSLVDVRPNAPTFINSETRVLKPGEVIPDNIPHVSAKAALERLKADKDSTTHVKKSSYENNVPNKIPQASIIPSENERARVKLIASRLHNAWSCSQGTLSSCTT